MTGKQGVSGSGIAALTGGSLLLWAAIKGRSWSNVLRELLSGKQPTTSQENPINLTGFSDSPASSSGTATNTFTGKGTPGNIPNKDWALVKTYGALYGIDPLVLVAIGFHETHWGTLGLGKQGLILGVGAYDSGASYKWRGLNAQLSQGAKILAQHGVHTIQDIMSGKASFWATDPQWKAGVVSWYNQLKK